MDTIFIRDLAVDTIIGIHEWEKTTRQTVILDIDLRCDISRAAASDDIVFAVDYFNVSERVQGYISSSQFNLIETLAEKCAEIILQEFNVKSVKISLAKPGAVKQASRVGVIIERGEKA